EIPRGGKRDVSAIHQIRRTEEFAILHASEDSLLYWSGRISDPETRGRLDEVAARKRTISRAELDLARIGEEISRIEQRQARMRDNLGVVPEGSAMAQRYLDALGADEDRIAAAEKQREGAEADIRRMKAGLAD